MQTLRQFVCGTDFSPCADHALALTIRLASAEQARVAVVHVCGLDADEARVRACAEALSMVVARHNHSHVEVGGVLRRGTPWKKLDNVAAEVGASLIVVGRHGAGRGRNVELGSVAEQLVRTAHRSVLIVTCDFECFVTERSEQRNKTL
jgi:nucleotide-binding universal stress UspA family protein